MMNENEANRECVVAYVERTAEFFRRLADEFAVDRIITWEYKLALKEKLDGEGE